MKYLDGLLFGGKCWVQVVLGRNPGVGGWLDCGKGKDNCGTERGVLSGRLRNVWSRLGGRGVQLSAVHGAPLLATPHRCGKQPGSMRFPGNQCQISGQKATLEPNPKHKLIRVEFRLLSLRPDRD